MDYLFFLLPARNDATFEFAWNVNLPLTFGFEGFLTALFSSQSRSTGLGDLITKVIFIISTNHFNGLPVFQVRVLKCIYSVPQDTCV